MTVYAWDNGNHTVVKIEKHGKKWYVYRLEKVILPAAPNTYPHQFIFSKKPFGSWSYQPFEDKDVKGDPEVFITDVKRWQSHLFSYQ